MTDNADDDLMPYPLPPGAFLKWEVPPNQSENTVNNSPCGTLVGGNATLTVTNAPVNGGGSCYVGGSVPESTSGFSYTYPYLYTYPWSYSYTDPRVTALEAKVETLEKMLAAVLSGREVRKPRRKRGS